MVFFCIEQKFDGFFSHLTYFYHISFTSPIDNAHFNNMSSNLLFQGPPGSQKKFSESTEMDEESMRRAKIEEETSYELMLKQQQLFLQWQLEMQSKVNNALNTQFTIF